MSRVRMHRILNHISINLWHWLRCNPFHEDHVAYETYNRHGYKHRVPFYLLFHIKTMLTQAAIS